MTLSEFKAWLDGFSAAIEGAPSPDQWAAIRAKLDTVEAVKFASPLLNYPQGVRANNAYPNNNGACRVADLLT